MDLYQENNQQPIHLPFPSPQLPQYTGEKPFLT